MPTKPKLELTWTGKENRTNLEPRILLEDGIEAYEALRLRAHVGRQLLGL